MSAIAPLKRAVKSTIGAISHWGIPSVEPIVVRILPHDPAMFTQGLACEQGFLYESNGSHASSSLVCRRISDWSVQAEAAVPGDFAEGIAIYQNRLYLLGWRSNTARVYSLPGLQKVGTYQYHGEGWGLCCCDGGLWMSDGTGTLTLRDAEFRAVRTLRVTQNRLPTRRLNDLEFVDNRLYANVLFRSELLEISATDGRVERVIDCAALHALAKTSDVEHTLNGVCYRREEGTFFVTGKCWPIMFEIRIPRHN